MNNERGRFYCFSNHIPINFLLVFINGYIADYQKSKPSYMFRFRYPDDFPFRPGDKVRLKSGWLFPNKQLVATVEKVECSMIKLKGIDRRVYEGSLVIAENEIEQAYFEKKRSKPRTTR